MRNVKHNLVFWGIKHIVKGRRHFHDPKIRSDVTADCGIFFQNQLAHLVWKLA